MSQILYLNCFTTGVEIGHLILQSCSIMITMRSCDLSQSSEYKTLDYCAGTLNVLKDHEKHLMKHCLYFKVCSHNSLTAGFQS